MKLTIRKIFLTIAFSAIIISFFFVKCEYLGQNDAMLTPLARTQTVSGSPKIVLRKSRTTSEPSESNVRVYVKRFSKNEGVPDVSVSVQKKDGVTSVNSQFTDENGLLQVFGLPYGEYFAFVVGGDGQTWRTPFIVSQPETQVILTLGSLKLAGRVLDNVGHSVADARIFIESVDGVFSADSTTNLDGTFAINDIPNVLLSVRLVDLRSESDPGVFYCSIDLREGNAYSSIGKTFTKGKSNGPGEVVLERHP